MTVTPRVLLSAYQCNPTGGSVSYIGWQWYTRLVQRLPVTLITHIRNYQALLAAGAPFAHSDIVFIDTEWFAGPIYRLTSKLFPNTEYPVSLFSSVDFYLYDGLATKQLKKRQQQGERWDIIHSVTPVSPQVVTRLHRLNYPLILGPWNGGLKAPLAFPKVVIQDLNWLYPLRNLGRLLDGVWHSSQHAQVILTATQATYHNIPKRYRNRCRFMLENGVDLDVFTPTPWPPPPSKTTPLKLLFVGRLVAFKGVDILLEAISRYQGPIHLTLIGEGPLKAHWQALALRLKIEGFIHWYGQASARQVAEQLAAAHVLCLPSVRESGGAVLLEAMACARPTIAVQYGGPAELVDETIGYLIPAHGPAAAIDALVNCFYDIITHPHHWHQRGEAGRKRAEQLYSWDNKINQALQLYQEVLHPS